MSVEADWFLTAHPNIKTIEALLPDCNGVMRGKWLPRHKLAKVYEGEFKLPITTLSLDIWGRDVEELVFESGDADGICRPIEGTLLPTPWTVDDSLGQVMLSLYNPDGSPCLSDPRHVLKCVVSHFHNAGWRPVVAAELEFSLVHYNREGIHHTCPRPAGGAPIGGNTYGLDVLHSNAVLLEDIRRACEIQDLPFDGIVKESAPSQYEINMQHVANPVLAADQIQMLKRLIKGVAAKHGLIASFMAKPFENEAGNGMHVHCSILDELGDNIFDDGSGLGSEQLRQAVAGADANPYLVFAVLLSSIFDGIEQKLDPGPPIEGDGYQQAGKPLPQYLPDAIHLFEKSEFIRRNLGEELQRIYSLSKHQENAEFRRRISELEYQSYLEKL